MHRHQTTEHPDTNPTEPAPPGEDRATAPDTAPPCSLRGRAGHMRLEFFTSASPGGAHLTAEVSDPANGQAVGQAELVLSPQAMYWLAARMSRVVPPTADGFPWWAIGELAGWLDNANGTSEAETALRLLKLSEEVGEVSAAYIGQMGQNPRKGATHSREDVADELCDVVITALVALHRFTANPEGHFAAKLAHVVHRMQDLCTCGDTPEPCPVHADAWQDEPEGGGE